MQDDFSELRPETRRMIEGHETGDVEFKENYRRIEPDDLISFANALGGTILVGVREEKDSSGMQYGTIVGCPGSFDDIRNFIQNKARSCRPQINVNISREDCDSNVIYRVDVEEALNKPCCTDKGTYLIRQNGRKTAIYPEQMTLLILEKEARKFITQLQDAGTKFVEKLSKQIQIVEKLTNEAIEVARTAQFAAEDAKSAAEDAAGFAEETSEKEW